MDDRRSIAGQLIGLLGSAITGYSLFAVFSAVGCASAGGSACPSLSAIWMIPVGIIAAIVGMFMGGGLVVLSSLLLAIGAGALAVGLLGLMPMMPGFPWLFGGIFFAAGLLFLVIAGLRQRSP